MATTAFTPNPVLEQVAKLVDRFPDLLPEKVWKLVTDVHSEYNLYMMRIEVRLEFNNGFVSKSLCIDDMDTAVGKKLNIAMPRDVLDEWRVDVLMRCGQ